MRVVDSNYMMKEKRDEYQRFLIEIEKFSSKNNNIPEFHEDQIEEVEFVK